MNRPLAVIASSFMLIVVGATRDRVDGVADTETAQIVGLKPLKRIVVCPAVFDGEFGGEVPTTATLLEIAEAKLKAASIVYERKVKHEETVVDRRISEARKTTGWMHLKVQVLRLPDRKARACRIVLQVQSPVTHPADPKAYVFANLYEDSKLIISADELTDQAIRSGMAEVFGGFCDRWAAAHKKDR